MLEKCTADQEKWAERMRRAFLATHPELDGTTRQYVEIGQVEPAQDAAAVVEEVKQLQEETRAQQEAINRADRERKEREEKERAAYERSPEGQRHRTRMRCADAVINVRESTASLETTVRWLRDIVRARARGVEMDANGRQTAALCNWLTKYVKQIGRFVPDLESCDEVARWEPFEEDEAEKRWGTQQDRTRALRSKEIALETQRRVCR